MCADESREIELEPESGSGATPPKRGISDEPEFQELLKRVDSLPPERKQALDELLEETKMSTKSFPWDLIAGTPRHHGICKLNQVQHALMYGNANERSKSTTEDIRLRVLDAYTDFWLARNSLAGSVPPEYIKEMDEICAEVQQYVPICEGTFKRSDCLDLFGKRKGRQVATLIADRMQRVCVSIMRFDAVCSYAEKTGDSRDITSE